MFQIESIISDNEYSFKMVVFLIRERVGVKKTVLDDAFNCSLGHDILFTSQAKGTLNE